MSQMSDGPDDFPNDLPDDGLPPEPPLGQGAYPEPTEPTTRVEAAESPVYPVEPSTEEVYFPGSPGETAPRAAAAYEGAGVPPTPPKKGRNLLLWGLGCGLVAIVLACAALIAVGGAGIFMARQAEREIIPAIEGVEPTDANPGGVQTDVFSLREGDCYNDGTSTGEGFVEELEVIDCSLPHDRELFTVLTYPAGPDEPFPGSDAFDPYREEECITAFESYVGLPYDESLLYVSTLTPTEGSWEDGDREIFCILYDPENSLTGSMEGSQR